MDSYLDDIRRLMEELADEGQATASAEVAAAEVESRARERVPDAWERFVRVVLTDKLQSESRRSRESGALMRLSRPGTRRSPSGLVKPRPRSRSDGRSSAAPRRLR